ncbi:MAG TPA: methyltransferase domain-containing protein [Rickettsiales bacterium]|nr:methyltransferase domain-containing protein [Rickettsiales bacterium]
MDNSKIFNRALLRKRRNRAAGEWERFNFLKLEAARRLADCVADVAREFPLVLDLGCHQGELASVLGASSHIIGADLAQAMQPDIVCDEELLPFASDIFDLVTSVLSLHHVNDLPGSLIQIRNTLKADGLFIAIVPGANTLIELRHSVTGASAEHGFPLSPRVAPFVEVRDAGALMQRAGFSLPVIGSESIEVHYDTPLKLMQDLRGMGESNVLCEQHPGFMSRAHIAAICDYYVRHFPSDEGGVTATFELVTMTGWKPHPSQQQAAKRGSGKINLNQALG